ncbi:MAG TPA: maleylacetoacetate isomerase [Steroidobacteraceae bacterium]|nr:maleylacetoacetate isomerase [Steroidobacteraceae bacterium]
MLRLHTYFRSSAAFRVRIALNLKGLAYQAAPVHLLREGGEQHTPAFRERNPAGLVPVLEDGSLVLAQSVAIMEYLDEAYPQPPLLPREAAARASVRALTLAIACDIHPLNNLRVLQYLESTVALEEAGKRAWSRHWIELGFDAIERTLARRGAGTVCYGDAPTLADCCLIPQAFNALRVQCALERWPTIRRIHDHCMRMPAFERAAPGAQPDAE